MDTDAAKELKELREQNGRGSNGSSLMPSWKKTRYVRWRRENSEPNR